MSRHKCMLETSIETLMRLHVLDRWLIFRDHVKCYHTISKIDCSTIVDSGDGWWNVLKTLCAYQNNIYTKGKHVNNTFYKCVAHRLTVYWFDVNHFHEFDLDIEFQCGHFNTHFSQFTISITFTHSRNIHKYLFLSNHNILQNYFIFSN